MYNSLTNRDDELYHIGILGRSGRYKWGSGQRPYQRLRDYSERELQAKKGVYEAESNFFNKAANSIPKRYLEPKKLTYKDLKLEKLTDDQLKSLINRFSLESQYVDWANKRTPHKERGAERVKEILTIAGSATAVAASAVGIAVAMKQLKG